VKDRRATYKDFMVESEDKRSLGRRENIINDLQEVECEGMNWIDLAKDNDRRWVVVNAVMNYPFP